MSKKIKDLFLVIFIFCFIAFFIFNFLGLFVQSDWASEVESIIRNVPLEEVQRKNSN